MRNLEKVVEFGHYSPGLLVMLNVYAMKSFILSLIAASLLVVAVPSHAWASSYFCSMPGTSYGFGVYPCTPGVVRVYVQVNTFGYGMASSPSAFTVTVSPQTAAPITFAGSAQGTAVAVAGSYTVSASAVAGYNDSYSLGCNGTVSNGEEATCIITENAYGAYGAYNYNYPYYTSAYTYANQGLSDTPPTVTIAQVSALPNTGFAPLSASMLALVTAVLSGLGLAILPYVRKIVATL